VHLSLGEQRTILEYAPWRVSCPRCGVLVEQVPWARPGSRFTRDFEETAALLAQLTNKTAVSQMMGISWSTVGNIIARVVGEKLDPRRLDGLKNIGVDEFSYRKRHRYITTVVDHDTARVVWAGKGKGQEALAAFFAELGPQRTAQLETVTMDMSAGYIGAVRQHAPHAQIVFDRFHVQQLAGNAVDKVRRQIQAELKTEGTPEEAKAIKGARFVLVKRPERRTIDEHFKLAQIQRHNAPLYRAYLLNQSLRDIFDVASTKDAERELNAWLAWASRSKLGPFVTTAATIRKHKRDILAFFDTRATNGRVEGFNSKLRMIARRAFGFHSAQALIAMLFLCCGGIALAPPLPGRWCPW
jgi:transposase